MIKWNLVKEMKFRICRLEFRILVYDHLTFPNTKQYNVTPIAQMSAALPLYLSRVAMRNCKFFCERKPEEIVGIFLFENFKQYKGDLIVLRQSTV